MTSDRISSLQNPSVAATSLRVNIESLQFPVGPVGSGLFLIQNWPHFVAATLASWLFLGPAQELWHLPCALPGPPFPQSCPRPGSRTFFWFLLRGEASPINTSSALCAPHPALFSPQMCPWVALLTLCFPPLECELRRHCLLFRAVSQCLVY